jgi:hypothetical protein
MPLRFACRANLTGNRRAIQRLALADERSLVDLCCFVLFLEDVFFLGAGTLPPARRASESPIAIACLRLVTFFPERPLFSVPALRSFIAFPTFSDAFLPYLFAMVDLLGHGRILVSCLPQTCDQSRRQLVPGCYIPTRPSCELCCCVLVATDGAYIASCASNARLRSRPPA